MTEMRKIDLKDVLAAKERRAELQESMRKLYQASIISLTINMPGDKKYTIDTVRLLYHAVGRLGEECRSMHCAICEERILHLPVGPLAIMAIHGDAIQLKRMCMSIEQETKYGRLLDIDVFDELGHQITRAAFGAADRTCFVCVGNTISCMREKRHSQAEIMAVVADLFRRFEAETTQLWPYPVQVIGAVAIESMLMEAACTPAPGLVDRYNSGAHRDMDFFSFIQSSSAISLAIYRCAFAAWRHEGAPSDLLPVLRLIGSDAEQAMLEATHGVNTQKGLIFLLGVIAAATALMWRQQRGVPEIESVLSMASSICRGIVEREMACLKQRLPDRKLTAGERLYLSHGITGIRGEVENGLSIVLQNGLPLLRKALNDGLSKNDALVHALLGLMSEAVDTTILNRHDMATLLEVQAASKSIMDDGGMMTPKGRERIRKLDIHYSSDRNISPGGSADLLAITYFLHTISQHSNAQT